MVYQIEFAPDTVADIYYATWETGTMTVKCWNRARGGDDVVETAILSASTLETALDVVAEKWYRPITVFPLA